MCTGGDCRCIGWDGHNVGCFGDSREGERCSEMGLTGVGLGRVTESICSMLCVSGVSCWFDWWMFDWTKHELSNVVTAGDVEWFVR